MADNSHGPRLAVFGCFKKSFERTCGTVQEARLNQAGH